MKVTQYVGDISVASERKAEVMSKIIGNTVELKFHDATWKMIPKGKPLFFYVFKKWQKEARGMKLVKET